ncbi:hypothetical protein HK099_007249 [Clydaea vesicula]|uniref:Uncharacterized protein n=1 Tax=Clydaea vesicula TaxID=447962 RepID=A0AAD5XY54_9FUNG|nr:hypothetical protein HK099_007249 [Clydaea vesicula]
MSGYNTYDQYGGGGYNQQQSPPVEMEKSPDTIYISNLPSTVTEASLSQMFGSIGVIKFDKKNAKKKIWVYMDKVTGLPKGDATVTYDDPQTSDAAVEWFDGKVFEGNNIKVEKAEQKVFVPGAGRGRGRGRGRGGGGGGFSDRGNSNFVERGSGRGAPGLGYQPNEGDWPCSQCGNSNFARRNACNKCQAPKPGGTDSNDRGGDRSRGHSDSRGNDRNYSDARGSERSYTDTRGTSDRRGGDRDSRSERDSRGDRDSRGGSDRNSERSERTNVSDSRGNSDRRRDDRKRDDRERSPHRSRPY